MRSEAKRAGRAAPKLLGPRPRGAQGPSWDARLPGYTLPFPGADSSVVRRTQARGKRGEPGASLRKTAGAHARRRRRPRGLAREAPRLVGS